MIILISPRIGFNLFINYMKPVQYDTTVKGQRMFLRPLTLIVLS